MIVFGHQDHHRAPPDGREAAHELITSLHTYSHLIVHEKRYACVVSSLKWPPVRQSTRGMVAVPRVFDHPTAVPVPCGGGTAAQAIG